jgi:hypothetical protein
MRKLVAVFAVTACILPALAFAAADPKPNSHFEYCTSPTTCPLDFNTNKAGTKIKRLSMYAKCSQVPVGKKGVFPPVAVNNGKFSKEGSIKNVIGETIDYKFEGKFKRPKKAVGTYELESKNCTDKARDFVAKRDGKATGGS